MAESENLSEQERVHACVDACAQRAWRLAYALLRNETDAFDVVQQSCLVAALKPRHIPMPPSDPWPWFRVVLIHEVRNAQRKARRNPRPIPLDTMGEPMEFIDSRSKDPSEKSEEIEVYHSLWHAINSLPLEERTALLLTHFGGLSHAVAAKSMGMPRQTLTTQVTRALDKLRDKLRKPESAILAQLAVIPVAQPDVGWTAAITSWKSGASSTLAASSLATTITAGGVMTISKSSLVASISIALGIGLAAGYYSSEFQLKETPRLSTIEAEKDFKIPAGRALTIEDAPQPLRAVIETSIADARKEEGERVRASMQNEVAQLRLEKTALVSERDALQTQLALTDAARAKAGPTFTFGEGGQLVEISQANWAEMAEASKSVAQALKDMVAYQDQGVAVPDSVGIAMQENVEKMRKYEYRVFQKLPSAAKYNGEFTHPISVTNLLAAELAQAGVPLTDTQIERISRIGERYESDIAGIRENYSAETLRVRKILDEYLLKSEFTNAVYEVLSAEQRGVVIDPATNHIAFLDLYCPSLMIIHTSPILQGADSEELKTKLTKFLTDRFAISEISQSDLALLMEQWGGGIAGILHEVPASRVRYYTFDESVIAGNATAELFSALLRRIEDAKTRAAILDEAGFIIPRLVAKPVTPGGQG